MNKGQFKKGHRVSVAMRNKISSGLRRNTLESFWDHVDFGNSCWIWKGMIDDHGYGEYYIDGQTKKAHRVAYEIMRGKIPPGLFACHHCDNPPCIRPSHLFLGTHADNMADMVAKGRHHVLEGEKHLSAKLKEVQVVEIRELFQKVGMSQAQLARRFHVNGGTINGIVRGRTWKHLAAFESGKP